MLPLLLKRFPGVDGEFNLLDSTTNYELLKSWPKTSAYDELGQAPPANSMSPMALSSPTKATFVQSYLSRISSAHGDCDAMPKPVGFNI